MRRMLVIRDACVAAPTTPWDCSHPQPPLPKKNAERTACFYHADNFPFQLSIQWRFTHTGSVALTKACQQKKEPQPHGPTQKPPDRWSFVSLRDWVIVQDTQCDWTLESDWKFAHHSLKANSVQVLGAIVPQYIGSAVRTGCTPVLDFCYLWRQRKMRGEKDMLKLFFILIRIYYNILLRVYYWTEGQSNLIALL